MNDNTSPYRFDAAIVRQPAASVVDGLRDGDGPDPDYGKLLGEHSQYVGALESAGLDVIMLPPLDAFPDSVFVEDPALVFSQGAILLRPGAPSRQGEADMLTDVLHDQFDTVMQLPDGYADGGDMLLTPHGVMIGRSNHTDDEGARTLQRCLEQLGLSSTIVDTPADVLHFKSDCALLDEQHILSTHRLAVSGVFSQFTVIEVPDGEEAAANALRVNDVVLVGQDYPRTIELLGRHGFDVVPLPTSEIGRIDAGLSCMSLRWKRP